MTFLYKNLNGFFSLLDLFDIEKLMELSQNFMDCIFEKIRYVIQIPNVLVFSSSIYVFSEWSRNISRFKYTGHSITTCRGSLECPRGLKFEKKPSSYFRRYFIPLCTGNIITLHWMNFKCYYYWQLKVCANLPTYDTIIKMRYHTYTNSFRGNYSF